MVDLELIRDKVGDAIKLVADAEERLMNKMDKLHYKLNWQVAQLQQAGIHHKNVKGRFQIRCYVWYELLKAPGVHTEQQKRIRGEWLDVTGPNTMGELFGYNFPDRHFADMQLQSIRHGFKGHEYNIDLKFAVVELDDEGEPIDAPELESCLDD